MLKLPVCPNYHPNSELVGRPGYYPNISEAQYSAVRELKNLLYENELDYTDEYENDFLKLLRFSRARQFDVEKAFILLKSDIEWRETMKGLKESSAYDVLQMDLKIAYQYLPAWVGGNDKQMRPISWRKFGRLEIWQLCKYTSMENLLRFHAWEADQAIRLMNDNSKSSGYNIETFLVIIDAADWHIGLATADAMRFIQGVVIIDSNHFPERLGACIIINAPTVLSFTYRIINSFLDPVTRKKMQILSHRDDWLPVLRSLIDDDQIPAQYGGTCPDPDPEAAYDTMNPPGAIAREPATSIEAQLLCTSTSRAIINSADTSAASIQKMDDKLSHPIKDASFSRSIIKSEVNKESSWFEAVGEWLLDSESASFAKVERADSNICNKASVSLDKGTQTDPADFKDDEVYTSRANVNGNHFEAQPCPQPKDRFLPGVSEQCQCNLS